MSILTLDNLIPVEFAVTCVGNVSLLISLFVLRGCIAVICLFEWQCFFSLKRKIVSRHSSACRRPVR